MSTLKWYSPDTTISIGTSLPLTKVLNLFLTIARGTAHTECATQSHNHTQQIWQMRSDVHNLPSLIRQIRSDVLSVHISLLFFYMQLKTVYFLKCPEKKRWPETPEWLM